MNSLTGQPGTIAHGQPSKIELIYLRPKNEEHRHYLEPLVKRVENFCIKLDTDVVPYIFCGNLKALYENDDPRLNLIIVVDENDEIIGHILSTLEYQAGVTFVLVVQAEMDIHIDKPERQRILAALNTWGKVMGAKHITAITDRPKGMCRKFGFKPYKVVLKKDIE